MQSYISMYGLHSPTSGLSFFSSPQVGWSRASSWEGSLTPHLRTQKNQRRTLPGCPPSLAQFLQPDPVSQQVDWRKHQERVRLVVILLKWFPASSFEQNTHPSAKLLSAAQLVIRHMNKVLLQSPGRELKSSGQSARKTLIRGTRWSTGENMAKGLSGRNFRKPVTALECFFSTMYTTCQTNGKCLFTILSTNDKLLPRNK